MDVLRRLYDEMGSNPVTPDLPALPPSVQELLDDVLDGQGGVGVDPRTTDPLLDFLFGS